RDRALEGAYDVGTGNFADVRNDNEVVGCARLKPARESVALSPLRLPCRSVRRQIVDGDVVDPVEELTKPRLLIEKMEWFWPVREGASRLAYDEPVHDGSELVQPDLEQVCFATVEEAVEYTAHAELTAIRARLSTAVHVSCTRSATSNSVVGTNCSTRRGNET